MSKQLETEEEEEEEVEEEVEEEEEEEEEEKEEEEGRWEAAMASPAWAGQEEERRWFPLAAPMSLSCSGISIELITSLN